MAQNNQKEKGRNPCAEGLDKFLQRFCPDPGLVKSALERVGMAERMRWLTDGKYLCQKGDAADCYWLICQGQIRVEDEDTLVVTRQAGEIVGEQAFFRIGNDPKSLPARGSALKASGDAHVLRIDRALVHEMGSDEKAAWNETICRVLSAKLDEATHQRVGLHKDRATFQTLIERFVCSEGHEAALAALTNAGMRGPITPEACDAVMWFSDIAGFSSFALKLPPKEAGEIVRAIMDVQAEEIASTGGQIDKFMGDGLMAFWRGPDAQRLDAACTSALTAAHRTATRLDELFKTRGIPLDIRIGLHAGRVILGDFGGSDRIAFTAIGDTVNAAARYEQASKRSDGSSLGRVRASPAVFSRVSDASLLAHFEEQPAAFEDKHGRSFEVHVTKY
ncbi:MAG: cyclic nucleotide-binding domain-containing protein [Proteobacteria bacterium]|nr:cyclic nucleotide-binding domain-containing protein [Pseudomonadota bacterium]